MVYENFVIIKRQRYFKYLFLIIFFSSCNDSREFSEIAQVDDLANTDFVLTLDQIADLSKNQIYCPTILYAWNELKKELNGQIEIEDKFKELNNVNNSISHENSLSQSEINNSVKIDGNTIKARSLFKKFLPFEYDFKKNNYSLKFKSVAVESFGINGYDRDLNHQIKLLYYTNNKDFAVKLIPKTKGHEILLFKMPNRSETSLGELYKRLNRKIIAYTKIKKTTKEQWRYRIESEDILSIPVLNFNLEKSFENCIGNSFTSQKNKYLIEEFYQRIALILDEKGAKVESEAEITAKATEAMEYEPTSKKLIFDDFFFLVIKKTESENPYLAVWISNDELMKKR